MDYMVKLEKKQYQGGISMLTKSFIDKCIEGDALIFEIDDYVEDWHTGKYNTSLSKFLGMTKIEYNAWMLDDSIIPYIVNAHKNNISFETIIHNLNKK